MGDRSRFRMGPVMSAGIQMMTLMAAALLYFGWWTKAALSFAVGASMVVLAQTFPEHGAVILLGGIGIFGLIAVLILYAYYKGQALSEPQWCSGCPQSAPPKEPPQAVDPLRFLGLCLLRQLSVMTTNLLHMEPSSPTEDSSPRQPF